MQQAIATLAGPRSARRSYQIGDAIFAFLARFAGAFVLVLLGSLILSLLIGGLPAFRQFGFGFIGSTDWDPVQQVFGAAVSIYGTLVTSVVAMVIAVPLAFGIAFYLTELAPTWLRRPVGTAVELLAAVPSIIYGMWGFFVIVPLMSQYIQPFVIDSLDGIPVLEDLFAGPPFGTGIFTAALILAVMVIPFIAATMRDVFETVPAVYKEFGLRGGLHHLGGHALDRATLHKGLGGRRHHAGPRPCTGRDHGCDLCNRQYRPHRDQPVRSRQYHCLDRGTGVSREPGRQP